MDTLCVPVENQNILLRNKAITQMDWIFSASERILVLDHELQQIKRKTTSDDRILTHVPSSTWMSSCWTLQEAVVSPKIFIQFADGIVDLDFSIRKRQQQIENAHRTSSWQVSNGLLSLYDAMPCIGPRYKGVATSKIGAKRLQQFVKGWDAPLYRSTSKAEEVPGIFAILNDLSAGEIVALPSEERMKAILRAQDLLPLAILFAHNAVPEKCDLGNRWAPTKIDGDRVGLQYGVLKMTDDGLRFDISSGVMPWLFLIPYDVPHLVRFCLLDSKTGLYWHIELCCGEEDSYEKFRQHGHLYYDPSIIVKRR